MSSNNCIELKTKLYTKRKGPPYAAKDCLGQIKVGNNGLQYKAERKGNGPARWYRFHSSAKFKPISKGKSKGKNKESKNAVINLTGDSPVDETQRKLLLAKRKFMSLKGDDTGIHKTLNETNVRLQKMEQIILKRTNETKAAKEALAKFKKQMKQKEVDFNAQLQQKQVEYDRLEYEFSEMESDSYDELRRYRYGQEQAEKETKKLQTELNTLKEKYNGVIKGLKEKNNQLTKKNKDLNKVIKEYENMVASLK